MIKINKVIDLAVNLKGEGGRKRKEVDWVGGFGVGVGGELRANLWEISWFGRVDRNGIILN